MRFHAVDTGPDLNPEDISPNPKTQMCVVVRVHVCNTAVRQNPLPTRR